MREKLAKSQIVNQIMGCWFGYMRLTRMERGPDGHIQFVDPRWRKVGRATCRAVRRLRKDYP